MDPLDEQGLVVAANELGTAQNYWKYVNTVNPCGKTGLLNYGSLCKNRKATKVVVRVILAHNWRKNTFLKLAKIAKFQRIKGLSIV